MKKLSNIVGHLGSWACLEQEIIHLLTPKHKDWESPESKKSRGNSVYFCHHSAWAKKQEQKCSTILSKFRH